jgi:hypothetical protein
MGFKLLNMSDDKVCPFNVLGGGTVCYNGYPSQMYASKKQDKYVCRAWENNACADDCNHNSGEKCPCNGRCVLIGTTT